MKICILGAGALGCAIGAALSEAGHQTWLLNRSREHVEAINLHGLQVQDEHGERQVRVNATTDANDVGVTDLVVVLVKSFHTAEAIAGATALLGPQTLVLSLQNGLGHEDILAEVVGRSAYWLARPMWAVCCWHRGRSVLAWRANTHTSASWTGN